MKKRRYTPSSMFSLLCGLLMFFAASRMLGEPPAVVLAAFKAYSRGVEARLASQHRSANGFLAPIGAGGSAGEAKVRQGEAVIEQLKPEGGGDLSGALLHHWRGTAFAPGATAADFERLMRDFNAYPKNFSPQVLRGETVTVSGDHVTGSMRVRQKHVITVVMDSDYDVTFGRLDVRHGYSISESTRMSEIAGAGTRTERALGADEEHGFLWRLNTYWSYEERDGGLYLQVEAVTLTRAVPRGLGWVVGPYIQSIPRESLEFTLKSARKALLK